VIILKFDETEIVYENLKDELSWTSPNALLFFEYDGGFAGSVNAELLNNRVSINFAMGFILIHYYASIY
jgi:hypothetical protein